MAEALEVNKCLRSVHEKGAEHRHWRESVQKVHYLGSTCVSHLK